MGALAALLALATVAVAVFVARSSPRVAFTVLFASIVLLPASLSVPTGGVTSQLAVHRVVLLGAFAGLAWHHRQARLWRATPTVMAFLVYLALILLTGIVFAPTVLDVGDQVTAYLNIAEQAVVLVVCTALVRADPEATWFLRPVTFVLLVSAGIAGIEHITGDSWSHWLFQAVPSQQTNAAAAQLAVRAGTVRVRAGNEFPLGYAWVSAALLPAYVVLVLRQPRYRFPLLAVGGALIVATIYWSYARSAIVGIVVAVVVLGALARERQVSAVVVVAVALGIAGFVAAPALSHHFSASVDVGSVDVRQQRIPLVLDAVSAHPWTGLGLTGLQTLGLQGVDSTYLLSYGVTGTAGLAGLLALLVVAVLGVGRGAMTADRRQRTTAAALTAGVMTLIVAGGAFDAMALNGTADVLWVLVAVGTVVAEREQGAVTLRAAPSLLPAVISLAALVGIAAVLTAPAHYARQLQFSTLPVAQEAAFYDPDVPGNTLVNTVCGVAGATAERLPGVSVSCRNTFSAPGVGVLRVEGSSQRKVTAATKVIGDSLRTAGVRAFAVVPETPLAVGRPTAATTAPLWLPVVAMMLLFAWSGVALRAAQRRATRRRVP